MKTSLPFQFNISYFALAGFLFIVEVLIALFVRDRFIRPYFGDVLVVILVYSFVMTFLKLPVVPVAIGVIVFAFTIEFLQYLQIVKILGLENSEVMSTVLGTSFAWNDMVAYFAGFVVILIVERLRGGKSTNNQAPRNKFQAPITKCQNPNRAVDGENK
jgi:hypothetical protein